MTGIAKVKCTSCPRTGPVSPRTRCNYLVSLARLQRALRTHTHLPSSLPLPLRTSVTLCSPTERKEEANWLCPLPVFLVLFWSHTKVVPPTSRELKSTVSNVERLTHIDIVQRSYLYMEDYGIQGLREV